MDQVAEEYGIEEVLADAEVSGPIFYFAKKLKSVLKSVDVWWIKNNGKSTDSINIDIAIKLE